MACVVEFLCISVFNILCVNYKTLIRRMLLRISPKIFLRNVSLTKVPGLLIKVKNNFWSSLLILG